MWTARLETNPLRCWVCGPASSSGSKEEPLSKSRPWNFFLGMLCIGEAMGEFSGLRDGDDVVGDGPRSGERGSNEGTTEDEICLLVELRITG